MLLRSLLALIDDVNVSILLTQIEYLLVLITAY